MTGVVLGSDTNPGGRRYNEDRVNVEFVTTHAGLRLAVAVLADGVGGEARGERASQLAIDTKKAAWPPPWWRQSSTLTIPCLSPMPATAGSICVATASWYN
jgi:serine/threonine protein phosphatase PrpC